MFIEVVQNNGNQYLRLVQSERVVNKDGYKVSRKKVVLNIGPLAKYDDGQPNYVQRLKQSFQAGSPLIPALLPYCAKERHVRDCTSRPIRLRRMGNGWSTLVAIKEEGHQTA